MGLFFREKPTKERPNQFPDEKFEHALIPFSSLLRLRQNVSLQMEPTSPNHCIGT